MISGLGSKWLCDNLLGLGATPTWASHLASLTCAILTCGVARVVDRLSLCVGFPRLFGLELFPLRSQSLRYGKALLLIPCLGRLCSLGLGERFALHARPAWLHPDAAPQFSPPTIGAVRL